MKILFLSHKFYPFIGGIEVNSEVLATEFYKAGHEVVLMTWTLETDDKTFPFAVIRSPSIKQIIKEHKNAEVVFENNPSLQLSWPQFFLKRTHVIALRTWITRGSGKISWQDKLKQFWLRRASAVIAISESVRKNTWPKAVVIGNPYRSDLFVTRQDINRCSDFVFLGRLVSDKGADLAIRALHLVTEKMNNRYHLTIIGDGPQKESLQQLAFSLNLTNYIHFPGALRGNELVNELNKHSYFLVPSRWEEPFGNVALEGMACGCIPIVSDGGGLPDAVGDAGILFTRGNTESLVDKIQLLISDPVLAVTLRKNAIQHLLNHRPDVVAEKYLQVIRSATNN